MPPENVTIDGKTYEVGDILNPWLNRKSEAEKSRSDYLTQIRINRKFAAGQQHLDVNPRDGRVVKVNFRNIGGVQVKMLTNNRLDQYLLTAIGRLTGNDYRPNFLASTEDENADQITRMLNDAFQWGWDNEWDGDKKVMALMRLLVVDGTAAIRCRYDRKQGELVGDFPLKDGRPITDSKEARKYVAESAQLGKTVPLVTMREGKVGWEVLSMFNFLTPPGMEFPEDFPWIIVNRPVTVAEVQRRYGDMASGVQAEDIESDVAGLGYSGDSDKSKLSGRVMVNTGYELPTSASPNGRTIVFTKDSLLDFYSELPYNDHPRGPSHGVHFFRWQVIPGRFAGRAFIESGIGPQNILNKRSTQIDTIIDRNMPKTYIEEQSLARPKTGEPMEIIEVHAGAPLPNVVPGVAPGKWMLDDMEMQDNNIEKAMGMRSISLGQPPQGVSAYSAMALLSENDSLKLDPIAQDIRLGMIDLCWDTMESMRNWPREKQMNIAGPDGALRSFLFRSSVIPSRYVVHAPRQGALPRTQAAELQKINDIWNAAASVGQPLSLDWFVQSLNAGKAQKLPASLTNVSKHKAELENIVMYHTQEVVPVSPEDDDSAHAEIHGAFKQNLDAAVMAGDEDAAKISAVVEQHRQMHLQSAQTKQGAQQPTGGIPVTGAGTGVQQGTQGPTAGTLGAGTSPLGRMAAAGASPPWLFRPRPRTGL